ncbi:hypothetical protein G210_2498 [Candida maltosa Xu316]|uniref:Uncharacterized protein n=1 Tax=Candida maltosa (strain Xu316) TaxID=1245528 RepID=M3J579_CANMX|nr:hypothetical protein G210_2498 [Candida maltosa Xu316]
MQISWLTKYNQAHEHNLKLQDCETSFISFLKEHEVTSFTCKKSKKIPSVADTIIHLKFCSAIKVLKNRVLGGVDDDLQRLQKWKLFIMNAARRFIVFVNALHHKLRLQTTNNSIDRFQLMMDGLIPPLDVVMVWRTMMLNVDFFHDTFKRHDFIEFLQFPFPWAKLNSSIHNYSFEYLPDPSLKRNYVSLIKEYLDVSDFSMFDVDETNIPTSLAVYCPRCSRNLVENVRVDGGYGFGDRGFSTIIERKQSQCQCNGLRMLSHERLRRLQLGNDICDSKPLPGVCMSTKHDISKYDTSLKENLQDRLSSNLSLNDILHYCNNNKVVESYIYSNLLHCTLGDIPIQIHFHIDLVAYTVREEQFINEILELQLLHDPKIFTNIQTSRCKFLNYLTLLKENPEVFFTPTLEIDLILKTNQLTIPSKTNIFYETLYQQTFKGDEAHENNKKFLYMYSKKYKHSEPRNQSKIPGKVIKNVWNKIILEKNQDHEIKTERKAEEIKLRNYPSLNYCWFTGKGGCKDKYITRQLRYQDLYVNSPFTFRLDRNKC